QEYSEEFSETIGVSASLSRWREKTFFYTETTVITESSSFTKELLFEVIEFTELIQFDADLYLILPTIPVEDEVSTFGTIALVIAIIALAIGIVAFTRRS
ncbi:hypothetical protein KAU92_05340, partial [Candidatus Bathyarchaeota archaeon]|nr:hypothetical protein [Candidatus Bathyarchaeota archaeon]